MNDPLEKLSHNLAAQIGKTAGEAEQIIREQVKHAYSAEEIANSPKLNRAQRRAQEKRQKAMMAKIRNSPRFKNQFQSLTDEKKTEVLMNILKKVSEQNAQFDLAKKQMSEEEKNGNNPED